MQVNRVAKDNAQTSMMHIKFSWHLVFFVYWSKNKRLKFYMWTLNYILNRDFSIGKFYHLSVYLYLDLFTEMNRYRYRKTFFLLYR